MPVMIAPERARQRITSAREASEVIHFDTPSSSAVRPSRLMPSFTRTQGRPRSMREMKPRFWCRAAASISPCSTVMPAAASLANPCPATW